VKLYRFSTNLLLILLLCFEVVLSETILAQEMPQQEMQRAAVQELADYIENLLHKGFAHREQIKSGQMNIASQQAMLRNDVPVSKRSREITIAFDENRQRVDQSNIFSPHNSYDEVGCRGCYKKDTRLILDFRRDNTESADGTHLQYVMDIWDEQQLAGAQIDGYDVATPWTEELGIVPQYLIYFNGATWRFPTKKTLEDAKNYLFVNTLGRLKALDEMLVGPSGWQPSITWTGIDKNSPFVAELSSFFTDHREEIVYKLTVTITKEEYKGTTCKKITFTSTFSDDAVVVNTLWIAIEQGYALRKYHYQNSRYDELLEIDVALDESSGIWFPSAWNYERTMLSGQPGFSQYGTVRNVVLNKPIPDDVFEIKNIEIIPAGVMVRWHAELVPPPHGVHPSGELLWDGNDIVTRGMLAENLVADIIAEDKSKRIQTIILANVIIVGLIVAIISWRYYQRLKQ